MKDEKMASLSISLTSTSQETEIKAIQSFKGSKL